MSPTVRDPDSCTAEALIKEAQAALRAPSPVRLRSVQELFGADALDDKR